MNYLRFDKKSKCLYVKNPNDNNNNNNKEIVYENLKNYTVNEVQNDDKAYYVSFKNIEINEILVHDDVIDVKEVKHENHFAQFTTSKKETFCIERVNITDDRGMRTWKIKIKHKFYRLYKKILDYINNF